MLVFGLDGNNMLVGVCCIVDGVDIDMASDWEFSDFFNGNDNMFIVGMLMMLVVFVVSGCEDLFFFEYMEGSGSNKCVEIYNFISFFVNLSVGNY